jgi:hypothetical protein
MFGHSRFMKTHTPNFDNNNFYNEVNTPGLACHRKANWLELAREEFRPNKNLYGTMKTAKNAKSLVCSPYALLRCSCSIVGCSFQQL